MTQRYFTRQIQRRQECVNVRTCVLWPSPAAAAAASFEGSARNRVEWRRSTELKRRSRERLLWSGTATVGCAAQSRQAPVGSLRLEENQLLVNGWRGRAAGEGALVGGARAGRMSLCPISCPFKGFHGFLCFLLLWLNSAELWQLFNHAVSPPNPPNAPHTRVCESCSSWPKSPAAGSLPAALPQLLEILIARV